MLKGKKKNTLIFIHHLTFLSYPTPLTDRENVHQIFLFKSVQLSVDPLFIQVSQFIKPGDVFISKLFKS